MKILSNQYISQRTTKGRQNKSHREMNEYALCNSMSSPCNSVYIIFMAQRATKENDMRKNKQTKISPPKQKIISSFQQTAW
jgi:hypothetical protein